MNYLKTEIYDKFHCIAGDCPETCCGDWGIALDADTYKKYSELGIEMNINREKGIVTVPHKEDGTCCYLDSNRLCTLVTKYGDEMLSYTCSKYPRTAAMLDGNKELYLSNSCPEILNLLYKLDRPLCFELDDITNENTRIDVANENMLQDRNTVIDILQMQGFPLWAKLYTSYLFSKKISYTDEPLKKEKIRQSFSTLENLYTICNSLVQSEVSLEHCCSLQQKLLIHTRDFFPKNTTYYKVYHPLVPHIDACNKEEYKSFLPIFEKEIQPFYQFLENMLVNFLFNKGCTVHNNSTFSHNVIALMFEYSFIKFHLFVLWKRNGKQTLTWSTVREVACFYSRIIEHGMNGIKQIIDIYIKDNLLDDSTLFLIR